MRWPHRFWRNLGSICDRVVVSERRRSWRWWVCAGAGVTGAGAGLVLLARVLIDFFSRPLDVQDQYGSVVSMFVGVASLAVSAVVLVISGRQLRPDPARSPPVSQARRDAIQEVPETHLGRLPRFDDEDLDVLALGVHRAISAPDPVAQDGQEQPAFVSRDCDQELDRWAADAAEHGGFLLIAGTSSVGKTRLLVELGRRAFGDFSILVPGPGDGAVVNQVALGPLPAPKLVVWLDELQRFLPGMQAGRGDTPVTADTIRRLLLAPTPVVIMATIWPTYLTEVRSARPDQEPESGHPAADILRVRHLHEVVLTTFSAAERQSAAAAAASDPRLRVAVDHASFGVTETLAGAPTLVNRYEKAPDEPHAIIHALADAHRLGVQTPLGPDVLLEAAVGYLHAEPTGQDWFTAALDVLLEPDRATTLLLRHGVASESGPSGYIVADYLLQHITRKRRTAPIPHETWQALSAHVDGPAECSRFITEARNRLRYRYAEPVAVRRADHYSGRRSDLMVDVNAADWLADLWADQERIVDLRNRADGGDWQTIRRLADVLVNDERFDELASRAGRGDGWAASAYASALLSRVDVAGAIDVLSTAASRGDRNAASRLREVLIDHGAVRSHREAGAIAISALTDAADRGDGLASSLLADALADTGLLDELKSRSVFDPAAAVRLATRAKDAGDLRQATEALAPHAGSGASTATSLLAELLFIQRRIDELVALVQLDGAAAVDLVKLRFLQGRGDVARALLSTHASHATSGWAATDRQVTLLLVSGRLNEARAVLTAAERSGGAVAAKRLDELELRHRTPQEALSRLRWRVEHRDGAALRPLALLLAGCGRLDELRALADGGNQQVADVLAKVLVAREELDELRERARTFRGSRSSYADVLFARNDVGGLRALADDGVSSAAARLADLVVGRGDAAEVRRRADAGDPSCIRRLPSFARDVASISHALKLLRGDAVRSGSHVLVRYLLHLGRYEELVSRAVDGDLSAVGPAVRHTLAVGDLSTVQALIRAHLNAAAFALRRYKRSLPAAVVAELKKTAMSAPDACDSSVFMLLAEHGDPEVAISLAKETKRKSAQSDVVRVLVSAGRLDEARDLLPAVRGVLGSWSVLELADALVSQDRVDEAVEVLADRLAGGDEAVVNRLGKVLTDAGRVAELERYRNAGHGWAALRLSDLFAGEPDADPAIELLRVRADLGERPAATRLTVLLSGLGRLDDLRAEVEAGTPTAAQRWLDLLVRQGRGAEAAAARTWGLTADGRVSGPYV